MRKDLTRNLCNFQKIFLTNKKDDPQHNKMAPAQIINSTKISWIKKLLQSDEACLYFIEDSHYKSTLTIKISL